MWLLLFLLSTAAIVAPVSASAPAPFRASTTRMALVLSIARVSASRTKTFINGSALVWIPCGTGHDRLVKLVRIFELVRIHDGEDEACDYQEEEQSEGHSAGPLELVSTAHDFVISRF